MMTTRRAVTSYAVLPLLLLLAACPGDDTPPPAENLKPSFQQDVAVRQLLPAPADSTWKDQEPVMTPIKVGADSLPVMVMWTPAHRDAHRAISRIDVAFPEHPDTYSLSAALRGGPVNHGTKAAIVQGFTLQVNGTRGTDPAPKLIHLSGDGTAKVY